MLKSICGCCVVVFVFCGILFGVILIPSVDSRLNVEVEKLDSGSAYLACRTILHVRNFAYCLGKHGTESWYLGCFKPKLGIDMIKVYGFNPGVGRMLSFSISSLWHGPDSSREWVGHYSHAEYRNITYNPKAGRPPHSFVLSQQQSIVHGLLPRDGAILLHFDTGSAEHTARRLLMADTLPALAQSPAPIELKLPSSVMSSDAANFDLNKNLKQVVHDVVGYNLFMQLFGTDVEEELPLLFEYNNLIAPAVIGIPMSAGCGTRLAQIRKQVLDKVMASTIGKNIMSVASSRGMDGQDCLEEILWTVMFAGYGGTSNLVFEIIRTTIAKDPKTYVPLFEKDPMAYILEGARLNPPVGGMNYFAYRERKVFTFKTGVSVTREPGDVGIAFCSPANKDPTVFKDAGAFKPGRQNAERLVSWNNEVADFKKCDTVAGCAEAPRGCPGTFLSWRISAAVTSFFADGISKAAKQMSEEL